MVLFMNSEKDRSIGSLIGLAVGDAVGTTLEFKTRDSYEHLTDMIGGGPFSLPVGAWTDDTSMALCLAVSLLESNEFNPDDQMQRYSRWQHNGYLSSTGVCFDIGGTVADALNRYAASGEPMSGSTHPGSAGNGSLMRLAPVVEFYYPNLEKVLYYSQQSSKTTHGAAECIDACRIFSELLHRAISGKNKSEILEPVELAGCTEFVTRIARMELTNLTRDQVKGSGYVMESLEAALWCFSHSTNFKEAILLAANLGDDADTTAAICGQIAGAHYGASAIPTTWKDKLVMRDQIVDIAARLYDVTA